MEEKSIKVFVEGPINPNLITEVITRHQSKTGIGAQQIFLGQIRADKIDDKTVTGIEYTTYEEMALKKFDAIKKEASAQFDLISMHIYHSLGFVPTGEISLFVFVSSAHRKESNKAIVWIVDEIKKKVPIFGKEMLGDDSHAWKKNII